MAIFNSYVSYYQRVADFVSPTFFNIVNQGLRAPQEWRLEVIAWKMTVLWRRGGVVVRAATEWDFSSHWVLYPKGERLHFAMERSTIFHGKMTTISTGPFSLC